jgi:hypothetical protein
VPSILNHGHYIFSVETGFRILEACFLAGRSKEAKNLMDAKREQRLFINQSLSGILDGFIGNGIVRAAVD